VTPHDTLRLLRDIPGVAGSYLLDQDAKVLVRDVSADLGDDLLATVGSRAAAALSAADQAMSETVGVTMRFARLSVYCSHAGTNLLVLLGAPSTSTSAVKMALRVSATSLAKVDAAEPAPQAPRQRGEGIWG
jgi:predicted regulator of Ras-like GTPase activity (Roadblock/LC7/MglB family)